MMNIETWAIMINSNANGSRCVMCMTMGMVSEIKVDIGKADYWNLYPRGSKPVQFYNTAKVYKITDNETVSALPLRPIVSNI